MYMAKRQTLCFNDSKSNKKHRNNNLDLIEEDFEPNEVNCPENNLALVERLRYDDLNDLTDSDNEIGFERINEELANQGDESESIDEDVPLPTSSDNFYYSEQYQYYEQYIQNKRQDNISSQSIDSVISNFIEKKLSRDTFCNENIWKLPVSKGSAISNLSFIYGFKDIVEKNSLPASVAHQLYDLNCKAFPRCNIPKALGNPRNISKALDTIFSPEIPLHAIDICPTKGCMVFSGSNSDLNQCCECGSERYYPCKRCKRYITNCKHNDRVPVQCMYYKSPIEIILALITTKWFRYYYEYTYNAIRIDDDTFCSILDGNKNQKSLREMRENFDIFKTDLLTNNYTKEIIEVSIIFSEFYDSGTIFKRSCESLSVMLFKILNFPHHVRDILGKTNTQIFGTLLKPFCNC